MLNRHLNIPARDQLLVLSTDLPATSHVEDTWNFWIFALHDRKVQEDELVLALVVRQAKTQSPQIACTLGVFVVLWLVEHGLTLGLQRAELIIGTAQRLDRYET